MFAKKVSAMIVTVIMLLLLAAPAAAERARIIHVTNNYSSDYDDTNPRFSANLLHFADFIWGTYEEGDSWHVHSYDAAARKYSRRLSFSAETNWLCDILDDGTVIASPKESGTLFALDLAGNRTELGAGECTRTSAILLKDRGISEQRKAEARRVLCTVPADTKFLGGSNRVLQVQDIHATFGSLPDGAVLAAIDTAKINRTAPHLEAASVLVLIRPERREKNYCVESALYSVDEEQACSLKSYDYNLFGEQSTRTLFTSFTTEAEKREFRTTCKYTLVQKNPKGMKNTHTRVFVRGIQGDYWEGESQTFKAPSAETPRSKVFTMKIGDLATDRGLLNYCGYLIRAVPQNPKLRTRSYTIGDIYCSHY